MLLARKRKHTVQKIEGIIGKWTTSFPGPFPYLESRPWERGWKVEPPSAAGLFVENQSSNATQCTFCKQQHPTASCHVVTNKMARKEYLKKQGRCFICLRKSHLARDCRSKISCFKCSGRHHVSLCEMEPTTETMANRQINVNSGNTTNRQHPSAHASTLHVGSQDSILLQTAQALIRRLNVLGRERE